jgi:hypothetical protein
VRAEIEAHDQTLSKWLSKCATCNEYQIPCRCMR